MNTRRNFLFNSALSVGALVLPFNFSEFNQVPEFKVGDVAKIKESVLAMGEFGTCHMNHTFKNHIVRIEAIKNIENGTNYHLKSINQKTGDWSVSFMNDSYKFPPGFAYLEKYRHEDLKKFSDMFEKA